MVPFFSLTRSCKTEEKRIGQVLCSIVFNSAFIHFFCPPPPPPPPLPRFPTKVEWFSPFPFFVLCSSPPSPLLSVCTTFLISLSRQQQSRWRRRRRKRSKEEQENEISLKAAARERKGGGRGRGRERRNRQVFLCSRSKWNCSWEEKKKRKNPFSSACGTEKRNAESASHLSWEVERREERRDCC